MERIALIIGEFVIYWRPLVITGAALTAIFLFLALYLKEEDTGIAAAAAVPLATALCIVFSRLVHWYCRFDSYPGFLQAMTDYSTGSYALVGAFAGCALTAALLKVLKLAPSIGHMFDCMAIAGSAGICVGRLASFFDTSDRGLLMTGIRSLPLAYPVTNPVSGITEYRLATFFLQAAVAGALFLWLLIYYTRRKKNGTLPSGDIALLFVMIYGASQVLLDSTRYDSLFLRSNGFVSLVQVVGALGLGLAIAVFSVRLVKRKGFWFGYLGLWIPIAALVGLAGYMEYYVQRHGSEALFAYSVMAASLAAIIILVLTIRTIGTSQTSGHNYKGKFAAK